MCSNLVIGGVSPSISLFRQVRKYTNLKVRVLLRPRYGDYCYNNYEFEELKEQVEMFREEGADGVVVGILNPDGTLNLEQLAKLKQVANSMEIALHRAFDMCIHPLEACIHLFREVPCLHRVFCISLHFQAQFYPTYDRK